VSTHIFELKSTPRYSGIPLFQSDLERAERLAPQGAIPQRQLEQARIDMPENVTHFSGAQT
jgi:hypothetical protein